jgi:hypothetical protein
MKRATEGSSRIFSANIGLAAGLHLIAIKTDQIATVLLNPDDFGLYTPLRRPYS